MREILTAVIAFMIVWVPIGIVGTIASLLYDWGQEDDQSQGFRAYAKGWLATQGGYLKAHAARVFVMVFNVFRQAFGTFGIGGGGR